MPWERCILLAALFVVAASALDIAAGEPPAVVFQTQPGRVTITIGERPLATYYYADPATPRPYFAHVRAPNGTQLTRNHPPAKDDLQDHALLHPGIWLAFGDLGGQDYWRLKARVQHERFVAEPTGGAGVGGFAVQNRYLAADGQATVCTEICRYTFCARPSGYLVVWDSTFRAMHDDFAFGDQEEMGLGVRLASALREDGGTGRVLSSEGVVGATETWGKPARWCDYAGTLDGQWVGLTIMAAAHNVRPSWWHNRGYGFFAANLFGRQAMRQGPPSKLVVRRGESFRLGYGILIHSSPTRADIDLDRAYADYLKFVASETADN